MPRASSNIGMLRHISEMVVVDDMIRVHRVTIRRVVDLVFWIGVQAQDARRPHPGLGEDFGILYGDFIAQRVSLARKTLDDVHGFGMKPTVAAQPSVIVEACIVHYKRVSFPVGDGIAIVGSIQIGPMRTPVGWNKPREIARLGYVKKDD